MARRANKTSVGISMREFVISKMFGILEPKNDGKLMAKKRHIEKNSMFRPRAVLGGRGVGPGWVRMAILAAR